jgi:hypothetical protein
MLLYPFAKKRRALASNWPLNLCRNEMPMNRPISDLNRAGEGAAATNIDASAGWGCKQLTPQKGMEIGARHQGI